MTRVIPGIILAAGWLLLLSQGNFPLFWGVVVLIGFIGGYEFCRMTLPDFLTATDRSVLAFIFCFPIISSVFSTHYGFVEMLGFFVSLCGMIGFIMYHYTRFENPFIVLNRGFMGIMFVGFLGSHLVLLRGLDGGAYWLITLSAVTAGADTCAYLVGCRWGRRKLCPNISPNKTVEGAIGGIAGGMGTAVLVNLFFPVNAGLATVLVLAFFLAIAGMIGDLLESIIKRGTGTKDSGRLLRGHGGVLDRIDSLLMAAPLLYYCLILAKI